MFRQTGFRLAPVTASLIVLILTVIIAIPLQARTANRSGAQRIMGTIRVGRPFPPTASPKATKSKSSEAPPVRQLYPAGTVRFSAPPPIAVTSGVQCDANGNIYAAYAQSLSRRYAPAKLPLTRLSLDSQSVVQFRVPTPEGYAFAQSQGFYVEPDGSVYGLLVAYRHWHGATAPPSSPVPLVVTYHSDGTVDSVIKLQLPEGVLVQPSRLAVFPDGNLLITGLTLSSGGRMPHPTGVFTGIFDRGGGYVGPITLPGDVKPKPVPVLKPGQTPPRANAKATTNPKTPHKPAGFWLMDVLGGLTLGSPDGNVYVIRPSSPVRVYVLSSVGTVLHKLLIKPPKPGMRPIEASLTSEGAIFMQFSQAPGAGNTQTVLALADPTTGKITETFKEPPRAGIPACVSPQNEILFLKESKAGKLEVAKFLPH